jgi:hypothetical protein
VTAGTARVQATRPTPRRKASREEQPPN